MSRNEVTIGCLSPQCKVPWFIAVCRHSGSGNVEKVFRIPRRICNALGEVFAWLHHGDRNWGRSPSQEVNRSENSGGPTTNNDDVAIHPSLTFDGRVGLRPKVSSSSSGCCTVRTRVRVRHPIE